jgi:hypothetical protein
MFSIHPFVRFRRGVGARATVALHVLMIFVVGYGAYLQRGRLLAVDYGTNAVLIAFSVPVLIASFVLKLALGRHLFNACCAKGYTRASAIRDTWKSSSR